MIKIENLKKVYGKVTAVDGLNLEIADKEVFALLGLNGAGKTTTINVLCSLIKKTSGKVFVDGLDQDSSPDEIKKLVSVSPQESAVAQNLTVKENLQLVADLYGVETDVNAIIEEFRLTDKTNARAKTLSGGQKRKLSLAMALVTNPKILILDEPTLGLDVRARRELWAHVEKLKGKITVILTTHYLEEAESLADRIGIMQRGKLVALGTASEIIKTANAENFEEAFLKLAEEDSDL